MVKPPDPYMTRHFYSIQVLYLAACQALAYQTKQIVGALTAAGHAPITAVFACVPTVVVCGVVQTSGVAVLRCDIEWLRVV